MSVEQVADNHNATLSAATHYIGVGGDNSLVHSIHLKWDAALVGTITVESSNFPDVALDSATAGDWIDEASIADVTPAAAASGTMIHVGNNGARRLRLKCVIGTPGVLRVRTHGKK